MQTIGASPCRQMLLPSKTFNKILGCPKVTTKSYSHVSRVGASTSGVSGYRYARSCGARLSVSSMNCSKCNLENNIVDPRRKACFAPQEEEFSGRKKPSRSELILRTVQNGLVGVAAAIMIVSGAIAPGAQAHLIEELPLVQEERKYSSPFADIIPSFTPVLGEVYFSEIETPDSDTPLWAIFSGLLVANILGVRAVQAVISKLQDKSSPVTLVKLQLGLTTEHSQIRGRLAELARMKQMGRQGVWIILEETLLEFSKYQGTCRLADVAAVQLDSKSEAYNLFEEVARHEGAKAQSKESVAYLYGENECVADYGEGESEASSNALMRWFQGGPADNKCDDAVVITLVVAAQGTLKVPAETKTWQDLCGVMKILGGLPSDRLMAVDLTWTPSRDDEYLTRDVVMQEYKGLRPLVK